jgi:hypothetical protein
LRGPLPLGLKLLRGLLPGRLRLVVGVRGPLPLGLDLLDPDEPQEGPAAPEQEC